MAQCRVRRSCEQAAARGRAVKAEVDMRSCASRVLDSVVGSLPRARFNIPFIIQKNMKKRHFASK